MRFWSANNKTVVTENSVKVHRLSLWVVVEIVVVVIDGDVAVAVVSIFDELHLMISALPSSERTWSKISMVGLLEE
jgi:hypothetical protein